MALDLEPIKARLARSTVDCWGRLEYDPDPDLVSLVAEVERLRQRVADLGDAAEVARERLAGEDA
jgi:hypothetical protein